MLQDRPIRAVARVHTGPTGHQAERVVFLLLDGFDHLALAGAISPLRLANDITGAAHYGWSVASLSGLPVTGADGMTVLVDGGCPLADSDMTLIVVGAPETRPAPDRSLLGLLRRAAAHGARLGALSAGVHALAAAGLLDGESCAIHWGQIDGFAEAYPGVRGQRQAYTTGRFLIAPGGAVAGEMMLNHLAGRHGAELATRIADMMVCGPVRSAASAQTVSLQSRYGMRNPRLVSVLQAMEENLETPLTAQDIADIAGMSVRQTERLFARYLQTTPMAFYAQLRLDRARTLLVQTELSVTEVAIACGFSSVSHFARAFRNAFGTSPRKTRAVAA